MLTTFLSNIKEKITIIKMSVSHTTNSYMHTLGHISSLKNYGIPDTCKSSNSSDNNGTFNSLTSESVNGSVGTFNSLTSDSVCGSTGTFHALTSDSVNGSTGTFHALSSDSVNGSTGTFHSLTSESVSGSVGTFNSLTSDLVCGSTGTFHSLTTNTLWGSTGNFNSLTSDSVCGSTGTFNSLMVGNLVLDSIPSIVTFTDDNGMIIDLGSLSTINIQTITLPSKINYVTYKNGLSNGMYIVKVVLSSFTFSLGNHSNGIVIPNVFNNTNTTFTSPYVLVNVNVFLDETNTLQYFSNATPYVSSTSY
jgi:hypothetical protein